MDVAHLVEEAEHDEVRRRADWRQDAANRAGIGRHEHESGRVLVVVEVDIAAVCCEHLLDGGEQAEADREHHGRRGRVADPAGAECGGEADGQEDAARIGADPGAREQPVGKALVDAVRHHGLGEDEAAHEEKDHGIGKGGEGHADRDDARHDGERRANQGGDGDGDGLCDPPERDENHDGEQFMRFECQARNRGEEYEQGQQRAAEQANRAAAAVE